MKNLRYFLFVLIASLALFGCGSGEEAIKAEEPAAEAEESAEEPAEAPPSNRGKAEAQVGSASVSIDYGRPPLKGRDISSELPDGGVWRFGMDTSTTLETSADLAFGETTIEAGQYSLWAKKVSADEWHLVVNSETGIWGTAHNPANDIAEIPFEKSDLAESVEQFTIEVNSTGDSSGEVVCQWGTLQLKVAFEVQ
ncbi:MAG: DUF2911 domain-containing protein [Acidobacteriota bacterium]